MRYEIRVEVMQEGKTTLAVRAELVSEDRALAVGTGRAQSTAKAVGVALERIWDQLVIAAVTDARAGLKGGTRKPADELAGPLPDETGPLFAVRGETA